MLFTKKPIVLESDIDYQVSSCGDYLLIWDLNKGGKSLTNDIVNVIRYIEQREGIDLSTYQIAYQDSCKTFDGVRFVNGKPRIYSLNMKSEKQVLDHFSRD